MGASLKERLLSFYGLKEADFASFSREPTLDDLPKLDNDAASKKAKARLLLAAKRKEKVLIYGDYDTDGIMATSIMTRALGKIGIHPAIFIPSRYSDGYGLNLDNAQKVAKAGYSLIILVDNGVCCINEISFLVSQGIEVIVIDHHEYGDALPPALAIIHPVLCNYGPYAVSAGYLSYAFSRFLLEKEDEYLLTLGALSTISDCMPIKGYNRSIVGLALRAIKANNYPEIAYLTDRTRLDEKTLSMAIIPQINAVGRIEKEHKGMRVVHYFADEAGQKEKTAAYLTTTNEARKRATKDAYSRLRIDPNLAAIVVIGTLPEGLNGLLANRLLHEYKKPTAVFSPSEANKNIYVGSMRSFEGFDIIDCLEALKEYAVRGGGHAHAGAISVRKEDFGAFREAFLSYALAHPSKPPKNALIPLDISECNMDSYRLIRAFGPFGQDHAEPHFRLTLPTDSLQFSRDGKYLSCPLAKGVRLFSFSFGKAQKDVRKETVDFDAVFSLEEYRGSVGLTLFLEPLEK